MRKDTLFLIVLFFIALVLSLLVIGCSTIEQQQESPADKVTQKESLPAPSSLVEDEATKLTLTAHELVKGISGNDIKQNIEQYFGKYAEITGVAKRVDARASGIDVTIDGEVDGELGGVICRMTTVDGVDSFEIGDTITIDGQIKALKEVPGNEVQDQLLIVSYAQLVRPCSIMPR